MKENFLTKLALVSRSFTCFYPRSTPGWAPQFFPACAIPPLLWPRAH